MSSPADTHPLVGPREPAVRSAVRAGDTFVGPGTLTLIAGPCAVESYDQTATACAAAVAAGATMLRGDLYKHRTSRPFLLARLHHTSRSSWTRPTGRGPASSSNRWHWPRSRRAPTG